MKHLEDQHNQHKASEGVTKHGSGNKKRGCCHREKVRGSNHNTYHAQLTKSPKADAEQEQAALQVGTDANLAKKLQYPEG